MGARAIASSSSSWPTVRVTTIATPSIRPRSSESSRGVRPNYSTRVFAKPWRGTSRTRPGSTAFAAARTAASALASARAYEGHRPRGRLRHAAVPHYARGEQAAVAGVRQAHDLLPAVDADAGRRPRHAHHLDA